MINYFWVARANPLPPSIRWKSFPAFLGQGRGRREKAASQPLCDEFNSSDRSISRIFRDRCRVESRGRERLWNFLGERRGRKGETGETIGEIVDRCIISSGERLNFSVPFLFPSLQFFQVYIFLSSAKGKFYFWLKTSINNVCLGRLGVGEVYEKVSRRNRRRRRRRRRREYWKLFQCFQEIFLMMSYDLIIPIKENDCCVKILDGFFQVSIVV